MRIVLFDLGNVIVDWKPVRLYREIFGNDAEAEAFCRDVCNMDWHVAHDRGVSFAENAALLISKFPQYEAEIRAWRTRWLDTFEGYVPGMPQIVEALYAGGVPIYGLSNLSAEIAEQTFDAFPVIRRLRDVVVSGAEGLIKPDPAIYHLTLKRMGSPPPETVLFVDDRLENIEAARSLGIEGHHFTGAEALKRALIGAGLLST